MVRNLSFTVTISEAKNIDKVISEIAFNRALNESLNENNNAA